VRHTAYIILSHFRFWWAGLLDLADLQLVDPGRGAVMSQLHQLSAAKQAILADESLSDDEKAEKVRYQFQRFGSAFIRCGPGSWKPIELRIRNIY
jgi:hypothetical protein